MQLAARKSAGWFVSAELHAVRAWQPSGLRQLGGAGQPRVGLRRRPPLLQEVRGPAQSVPRKE